MSRTKYRYGPRLGAGGMAEVFRATMLGAEGVERPVAIKRMLPSLSQDPAFAAMFVNEARISARLHHPNIVQVLDFDRDEDGTLFLVLELVDGVDLAALLKQGPLPPAVAAYVACELMKGLAHAHELSGEDGRPLGVVHRDVSPHNVLVSKDGSIKLSDFGIARALGAARAETSAVVRGKPLYMAPEQVLDPKRVDHRADLFAVGAILHELLTGQRLYRGETSDEVLADVVQVAHGQRALSAYREQPALGRVMRKLLAIEAEQRFASAEQARLALCAAEPPTVDAARLIADRVAHRPVAVVVTAERAQRTSTFEAMAAPTRTSQATARRRIARPVAVTVALAATGWIAIGRFSRRTTGEPSWSARSPDVRLVAPGDLDGADLSADGRQLAVVRDGRLTIEDVASGETRDLTPPGSRPRSASWFRDGRAVLLGVSGGPKTVDFEIVAVPDGSVEKLPFHGWWAQPAPSGGAIAVTDEQGISMVKRDGSARRLLVSRHANAPLYGLAWSPDARWLAYGTREAGDVPSIHAVEVATGSDVKILREPALAPPAGGFGPTAWLDSDLMLYQTYRDETAIAMEIELDPRTARPQGDPVVLAEVPDRATIGAASADGREILYGHYSSTEYRYLGALRPDRIELSPSERRSWDLVGEALEGTDVYRDDNEPSRTQILAVARSGRARLLARVAGKLRAAVVTADRQAVLFVDEFGPRTWLWRVEVSGTVPVPLLELPCTPKEPVQLDCASAGTSCFVGITHPDGQSLYSVDPSGTHFAPISSFAGQRSWGWAPSPDGTKLAVGSYMDDVHIVDATSGAAISTIPHPGFAVFTIVWEADDGTLLLGGGPIGSAAILRVRAGAPAQTIWSSDHETINEMRRTREGIYLHTVSWQGDDWLMRAPED